MVLPASNGYPLPKAASSLRSLRVTTLPDPDKLPLAHVLTGNLGKPDKYSGYSSRSTTYRVPKLFVAPLESKVDSQRYRSRNAMAFDALETKIRRIPTLEVRDGMWLREAAAYLARI
jgi:hypothetical protein